ncbi:MAG: hypothetical protein ACQEUZ_07725 [Pseudomonadota bacterium]
MLGAGLSVASVALRRGGGGPPEWPGDAAAVWLILGQSNADGWAPLAQDPAGSNAADAAVALTEAERAEHDWIRYTAPGSTEPTQAGVFTPRRVAPPPGEPRSASKLWQDPGAAGFGIPDATPGFGPEIGLVRHALTDPAAAHWREAAPDPRLYVLKGVQGGARVDALRYGGPLDVASFGAIRQTAARGLADLAASRTVLLQGLILCIGGTDANTINPATGESMAASYPRRMIAWIRSLRGLLSPDLPVVLLPPVDNAYPPREEVIAGLDAIAAALPHCHVVGAGPAGDVGDGNHHDAQTMSHLGEAAFRTIRQAHGRPGDGLVTDRPFAGFRPAFLVPPHFVDEFGNAAKVAAVSSLAAKLHGVVLPLGAEAPGAEAVRDAAASPLPGQIGAFTKHNLQPDVLFEGSTGSGTMQANETHDVFLVLEATDGSGALSDVAQATRAGAAKQASLSATPTADGGVDLAATVTPRGTWTWAIHEPANIPPSMSPQDVADLAFCPGPNEPDAYCEAGTAEATAYNEAVAASASGLTPGKDYVAFMVLRAADDLSNTDLAGKLSPAYRLPFTAIA